MEKRGNDGTQVLTNIYRGFRKTRRRPGQARRPVLLSGILPGSKHSVEDVLEL
jgi:hypothetical protein